MIPLFVNKKVALTGTFVVLLVCAAGMLFPQTRSGVRTRITQRVDDGVVVRLPNTTHRGILSAKDLGRVSPGLPMERIILMLQSSPEQERDLEELLKEQQDPSSPQYHHWLTPEQFGQRFGASQEDIDTITAWLKAHGFTIDSVAAGRRQIEFSGTAQQVEGAFRTEIHAYDSEGETRFANATDISIPEALTSVVPGLVSLDNFPLYRSRLRPLATAGDGSHQLSPNDFAAIYNVTALWNEQIDGSGQSIAIASSSNINLSDIASFRATMGLPPKPPQIILNGTDPGTSNQSAEGESDLDVEWSGAVAKGATIKMVVTPDSNAGPGIISSLQYIVSHNTAPILSISFGTCEAQTSPTQVQLFSNTFQQAQMQGMSVVVASGDSGGAACDPDTQLKATHGFGISVLSATPYNLAVGGTLFNDVGADATYWNTTNSPYLASVKSYIPEVAWNESGTHGILAGGGGVSTIFPTPFWQVGAGVPTADPANPSQHHRYVPDVSLAAGLHDGYLVVINGNLFPVSGTSAAAPSFAGILAMVNQLTNQANGNPSPQIYSLAAQSPSVFHDIVSGTNAVPCAVGSPNCSAGGVLNGYSAGPGYDLATGWGSVDAHALVHAWTGANGPSANLSITSPAPLEGGYVSIPYSQAVGASGGTAPYAWSISSGSLPPGLTLNAGVINGTPTTPGVYNFALQMADKSGAVRGQAQLIVIGTTLASGSSPTAAANLVFPEFADGQLGATFYRTTLMISNPSSAAAVNCTLQLHGFTVPGFLLNYSMPANGWVISSTSGTQPFQAGYATLQCSSSVEAQLLYSLYGSDGTKLSEATVFPSPPASSLNLVADETGGAQLGLAIANDSDQSVTYTVAVRGVPSGSVTVPPRGYVAKFVDQLVPQIPANSVSLVQISSTAGTASVIGLRFTGLVFTTIPASTSGSPDATAVAYHVFPQIADGRFSDGAYFRSTGIYINPTTAGPVGCGLQLHGMTSDGSSTFQEAISPGGGLASATSGTQVLQTGYGTVSCSSAVNAEVLYSFYGGDGTKLSEATVFSSPPSKTVQILADTREGAQVGVAIANDSDQSNTYTISAFDSNGQQVGSAPLTLAARTSVAKFISELMTTLPADYYGPVVVSSTSSSGTASLIGLRFTGNVFTTIPQTVR